MINYNYNYNYNVINFKSKNMKPVTDLQKIQDACKLLIGKIDTEKKPRVQVNINLADAGDVFISCTKSKSLIPTPENQKAVKISVHGKDKKSGAFAFLNEKGPNEFIKTLLGDNKTPGIIENLIKSLEKQLKKASSSEPKDLEF